MWHMGDGWGWWMVFGWIWMVAFWGLIVWAVVTIVNRLGGGRSDRETTPTAREILEQRYARGEISREEFQRMREELTQP